MNEVLGLAAMQIAHDAVMQGVSSEAAFARLSADRRALRNPLCRLDWDEFAAFMDELQMACGGPDKWEQVCEKGYPRVGPAIFPFLKLFIAPRDLYHFINGTVMRHVYRNVVLEEIHLSEGHLLVKMEVPPPFRPSRGFFHANAGAMRSCPQFMGLPCSEVRGHITDRIAEFLIVMPASRTVAARLRPKSLSTMAHAAVSEMERSWEEVHSLLEEVENENARLQEEVETRILAEAALRATLDMVPGSVFSVSADGLVSGLDDNAKAALQSQGEELARRVRRAAEGQSDDPTLSARPNGAGGHVVLHSDSGGAFADRLARAARGWRWTARHVEVAALVVRGQSNKEIAARLGCAAHTVDHHVTEILKRAGLDSRTALVARFWSEGI